jgi:hypothetical protein
VPRRPRILDELRQTRPFPRRRTRRGEPAAHDDVVRRHLARCTHESEVTPQQYNVLRILRGAGAEGIPTLEIARA